MKKVINASCVALGFLCAALGTIGIALPILPTTPLYLAAAILFAKGSERFHKWFVSTTLYQRYIVQTMNKRMDKKSKCKLLITLGIVFAAGIYFSPVFAKIIILVVAAVHFYYFLFKVKTVTTEEKMEDYNV